MELTELQIFRAVAEAGSITRAAERLHRVPSNVTTRLQQLEDSLGTRLFLREGRRLVITPAGELLLDYACRIEALVQEAKDALHDGAPRGRLRLGAMESTAACRLPGPLAEYHRRFPHVAIELATDPSRQLLARVLQGELDAALLADSPTDERLESLSAFNEELVVVTSRGHPPVRAPGDVQTRTLLAFASGCAYRRRLEEWFAGAGVAPERVVELTSYHAILVCAVAGMGVAMLPRALLSIFPSRTRLEVHRLPAPWRWSLTALVWRKGADSARLAALAKLLAARQGAAAGTRSRARQAAGVAPTWR